MNKVKIAFIILILLFTILVVYFHYYKYDNRRLSFGGERVYDSISVQKVVKIHDGDTIVVNLSNLPDVFGSKISIRLDGIDAPELKSTDKYVKKLAYIAKDRLELLLKDSKDIQLVNIKRDKYFRFDAEIIADGVNVNKILIKEKLAKPYNGGKRSRWDKSDYSNYINNINVFK